MTDNEGIIEHISSSCMNFLKIENKFIVGKSRHIEDLKDNIFKNRENYKAK